MTELSTRHHADEPRLRTAGRVAEVLLRIDAARLYGLIEGGPEINVDRCEEVIAEAAAAGFTYTEEEIIQASRDWIAWANATPEQRAALLGEDAP